MKKGGVKGERIHKAKGKASKCREDREREDKIKWFGKHTNICLVLPRGVINYGGAGIRERKKKDDKRVERGREYTKQKGKKVKRRQTEREKIKWFGKPHKYLPDATLQVDH